MHYLSPTAYTYFLWCGHVVNRGQQNFGGLLYVGSNSSYFSDDNDDDDDDDDGHNNNNNEFPWY